MSYVESIPFLFGAEDAAGLFAKGSGEGGSYRIGQVIACNYPSMTCTITFDGSVTSVPGIPYLHPYTPVISDIVRVHKLGRSVVAVGRVWPPYNTFGTVVDQGASTNIGYNFTARHYKVSGNEVTFWFELTLTSNGTAGSLIRVLLPIATTVFTSSQIVGEGIYYDSNVATRYACGMEMTNSGTQVLFVNDASGGSGVGIAPAITAGTNDALRGVCKYLV